MTHHETDSPLASALIKLDSLEHKLEILEDLVKGDEERNISGLVEDLTGLRADLYELVKSYEHDKVLVKGIGYGLGLTSFASVATLISQLFGIGGGGAA